MQPAASVRRFELVEGASSKFWEISLAGSSFTVRYGRIGSDGTSKTTDAGTPEKAAAEVDKLIREKTRKGYQEAGGAPPTWRPPGAYALNEHVQRFLGYAVCDFNPEADGEAEEEGRRAYPTLRDLDRRVFAVGVTYDDDDATFAARLGALLDDPKVGDLKALVIGPWFTEYDEDGPVDAVAQLIAGAGRLGSLKGLFVGDILQEESEISWIHQTDLGPLLNALPSLEEVVVRGANDLRFTGLKHPNLRTIQVQSGGLNREALGDLLAADLPELRNLVLWLGVDDYGADWKIEDLKPLFDGALFPQLEHLGLMNSESEDEIAVAIASAPLLGRLKGLDLSMGTLSDVGGQTLLDSPGVRGLQHLNLRHSYLSEAMAGKLRKLGIDVNVRDRQEADEDDEDYRYVEVSE